MTEDADMVSVHPNYIEKNGRVEFVVLPVEEFRSLQEYVEDMEDLLDLRNAKEEEDEAATVSLDDLKGPDGTMS